MATTGKWGQRGQRGNDGGRGREAGVAWGWVLGPTLGSRSNVRPTGRGLVRRRARTGWAQEQPRLAIGESSVDFADALSPFLLKRLLKGRGGCSGMTVSPTANGADQQVVAGGVEGQPRLWVGRDTVCGARRGEGGV